MQHKKAGNGDPYFIWEPMKPKKGDIDHFCSSPTFSKLCSRVKHDLGTSEIPAFPYCIRASSDGV